MDEKSLLEHISVIRDPRQSWEIEHSLTDIIFLMVAAFIAGAEGWEDIEDFGEDNLEWLRQYGDFTNLLVLNIHKRLLLFLLYRFNYLFQY